MNTLPALRIVERNIVMFRRLWWSSLVTSLLQPLLYLLAMGLGVGTLINSNSGSTDLLGGLTYIQFVAPGLLATTTMMVASVESLWPVLEGVLWGRQYEAMAATPLRAKDIAVAHALWMMVRTGVAATTVAAAMALFPSIRSWGLIPAIPVAMLAGVAFGMPFAAWAITRTREISFPIIQRFIIVPLFLFGGAFFPLSQLPPFFRAIGYATPLWHAVELCRSLVSGTPMTAAAAFGHLLYLVAWGVIGGLLMAKFTKRRLFS